MSNTLESLRRMGWKCSTPTAATPFYSARKGNTRVNMESEALLVKMIMSYHTRLT